MDHSDNLIQAPEGFHAGYVAICGYPNAGKSTLMNTILEHRLGIVSPRPQTTRRRTLGIRTTDNCQMIFVDTPGILEPDYDLQAAMMKIVNDSIKDADILLYLVDLTKPAVAPGIIEASKTKPVIALLNKADKLANQEESLRIIDHVSAQGSFSDYFTISALKNRGIEGMLERVEALLPLGPPFYPPDQLTEHPERFFVGELIREAIFRQFREEVPYSTEVQIDEFKEKRGAKDRIEATIFVESDSQKGILIGKGGAAIKSLGQSARQSVEQFLDREVFLGLHVKVMPKWRRDSRMLKKFGY
jgi:GTPase